MIMHPELPTFGKGIATLANPLVESKALSYARLGIAFGMVVETTGIILIRGDFRSEHSDFVVTALQCGGGALLMGIATILAIGSAVEGVAQHFIKIDDFKI
jgi:hypothetical protein